MVATVFADLCLAVLSAIAFCGLVIVASYAWDGVAGWFLQARRQARLTRRLLKERPGWKTRRQCIHDARWIVSRSAVMAAELREQTIGLTPEQVRFRASVELDLWQIPTTTSVEEVA